MANGVPVRLSEGLAARVRASASVLDRSLTEQVEHWARLGQIVESVISAGAVERLKARSVDRDLAKRLEAADTPAGRAKAAKVIRERNPVRNGVDSSGALMRIDRKGKRTKITTPR
ncbi:MAG: hypothetical protein H0T42_18645 [Deltaproteobacteria bacterium]|nr:hypothetical protein [Deltaproteobacteria bacterium]